MATFEATTVNGDVVLFDGTTRVVLKLTVGPFTQFEADVIARHISNFGQSMTVERFAPALGAADPDAGLEDL